MGDRALYPQADDVGAFLAGAGISATALADLDLQSAADAGRSAFEMETGRKMLADADDVTRYFDPPGSNRIMLDADLATFTSLIYQPQGASAQTLVENTDFRLQPYNAPAEGKPYRWIETWRRYWQPLWTTYQGAIKVTGRWGYATTIPDDAWDAMRLGACLYLFAGGWYRQMGGLAGYKEGDTSRNFEPGTSVTQAWQMTYDRTVARYRRAEL